MPSAACRTIPKATRPTTTPELCCSPSRWIIRGPAPARSYIPELLDDVLAGTIDPGRVFDYETDLDHVADGYAAMDERRAIKSLIRVGSV